MTVSQCVIMRGFLTHHLLLVPSTAALSLSLSLSHTLSLSLSLSTPTLLPSPPPHRLPPFLMSSSHSLAAEEVAQAHSQQQRQRQQQRVEAEEKASREHKHKAVGGSAAAASIPRLATAQQFHTDGLHSIFAFLELKELPSSAAVCFNWRNAVYKEPGRSVSVSHMKSLQLPFFVASPLSRHVQSLDLLEQKSCSLAEVKLMQQLPALTELRFLVNGDAFWEAAQSVSADQSASLVVSHLFPSGLRQLGLKLDHCAQPMQTQQLLLDVASHQHSLTELSLDFTAVETDGVDLSVLQRLPLLTWLALKGWRLGEVNVLALASLASLELLSVDEGAGWSAELLALLCDPAQCKLVRLRYLQLQNCVVTAAHMQALALLPALEQLHSWFVQPDALPLLSSLPSLTSLTVMMVGATAANLAPAAQLLPHLAACAQLKLIRLPYFSFTEADLKALFTALPKLSNCTLEAAEFPPLAVALESAPQIRGLHIWNCPKFRLVDLPQCWKTT